MTRMDDLFDGAVLRPGDERYDCLRANWRGVDSRPALIVDAVSARDVATALHVAGDQGLAVAVQNSGHGPLTPHHGALLLRTSNLGGLSIDVDRRTARVGAGVLLRDVMAAAAPYELAPLSGSTPWLGAAGFTLGGGVGWLTRLYGYAADSLVGAEVATPAGHAIRADARHEADLLWGLRGAGGSLGVVTSIDIELHPLSHLYGGIVVCTGRDLIDVLTHYREWSAELPDELSTALVVRRFPPGRRPWGEPVAVGLRVLFHGPADKAEALVAPFLQQAGAEVMNTLRSRSLASRAAAARPVPVSPPAGGIELFRQVPDVVLEDLAGAVTAPDSPLSLVEFRHWGGVICRQDVRASPAGPRDIQYGITVEANDDARDFGGRVGALMARMVTHSHGGAMRNLLLDHSDARRAYAVENHARLTALKHTWDPGDVLRVGADGWPT